MACSILVNTPNFIIESASASPSAGLLPQENATPSSDFTKMIAAQDLGGVQRAEVVPEVYVEKLEDPLRYASTAGLSCEDRVFATGTAEPVSIHPEEEMIWEESDAPLSVEAPPNPNYPKLTKGSSDL